MASPSSKSSDARPRMTPGGPACPKMSVDIKSAKTNPPQDGRILSPQLRAAALAMAAEKTVAQTLRGNPVARPAVAPGDPAWPTMSAKIENAKTNPPRIVDALTPRQLAAARAMVVGKTVGQTVREVRVARRTLFRWRRLPAFVAEMRRLHERLAMASAAVRG